MSGDLFGHTPAPAMRVRLDRTTDREQPCCENIAVIWPGKGPHAGELRCDGCGRHRGWLPREALDFLTDLSQRFGAPAEPLTLREQTIGDHQMATGDYDNTNRGVLFRNEDKQDPKHADYNGNVNVNGEEFWLNGWLKTSKKGAKYLSLSVKPKNGGKETTKPDYDDDIGF
jgi:hypothetical protein